MGLIHCLLEYFTINEEIIFIGPYNELYDHGDQQYIILNEFPDVVLEYNLQPNLDVNEFGDVFLLILF